MYDKNNIFWKIIQKDINTDFIFETQTTLIFKDINPTAKIHLLAIPRNPYINFSDFMNKASNEEKITFWNDIYNLISKLNINEYQLLTNCGSSAGQTVLHFHVHILSNKE